MPQVIRFNGTAIDSLKQLAKLVLNCTEEYMRFDLEYDEVVIVETLVAKTATKDVLTAHSISNAMSSDLKLELDDFVSSELL